jgi:release factor glutamine methyltransferase
MTCRRLEQAATSRLGSATEARWLVEHVIHKSTMQDQEAVGARVTDLVEARIAGEPLQYLLGEWAFRTLELTVDRRALIPRPETEQVVEVALGELRRRRPVVVDLGTGGGAVALSIAVEVPGAQVWATDVDVGALALASANRDRVGAAVWLRAGSWFDALPRELLGRVDLVVSNPPYVSDAEWERLDPEVRREPYGALVAGPGSDGTPGLAGVEAVLRGSVEWLRRPGAVVVELAPHQAAAAVAVAREVGLHDVRVAPDLTGRDRAVVGRV